MRKIIFLFVFAVLAQCSYAQFGTVQFSPSTFTGDDAVTFTIDLTGTTLAGEPEVYIWIFANGGSTESQYPPKDGITTNTSWSNSPAAAKFTNIGGNKWSYTFTGSALFGLTPGQLKHFQFLVKTKTGNKQTSDSPKYPFAPVTYVPATYRLFPSRMNQDDAITIYFYQDLATDITENRMVPTSVSVTMYDANNNVYGVPMNFPVTDLGGKIFKFKGFIPSYSWNVPTGTVLSKFTYTVKGTYYDTNGATINVSGSTNTRAFDVLHL